MYRVASKLASSISSASASKKRVCSRFICNRNYVAKDINFGVRAQAAMLEGVSEVSEAVKIAMGLGPKGHNVIVEKSMGNPKVTKDGVTVVESIKLKDKDKNAGANMVKQVASAPNKVAGDGTTYANVLTQAILTEGCKSIADMRTGINMAVEAVISDLKRRARMISTLEEITQELQNPLILIYGKEISTFISIAYMFDLVKKESREVLVVAEDVEGDALNFLFLCKNLGVSKQVCAVKAPSLGENRRASLEDLAILTGGEVIYEYPERGNVKIEMFGTAKKVIVSVDDTIIIHGGGDKKLIEERCEQLRTAMEKSDTMFERERAQERLSKLSDAIVLKVGGASKAEVGERKDMVEDALNATRAAAEEGIVPGGGVGLLYATKALENLQTQNNNQNQGIQNFQNAITATALTIASKAGFEGSLINKLLEQDDYNLGIDAAIGEFVDMKKTGIIEPVKVIRTALVEAASVTLPPTTTEAAAVPGA
ncbi:hypothetical protein Dsin_018329 [Dipteronia sinensis]|uniref:Uncharacterized protein n=1 Tax=Dipteronia sinensis TaxID=43782 RepID=A0AAE0E1U1_9ROSI|nr:hypothetical protein Dsin_018329 [Dipteronia sinensis]